MQTQEYNRFLPQEFQTEDKRTDFLKAQAALRNGHVINCCLTDGFGCKDDELLQNGVCRHFIGMTVPGDKEFHPFKDRPTTTPNGTMSFRYLDGNDPQPVLPTDKLVPVSDGICSRVYRNVDELSAPKKKEKAAA